ncbi:MAG: hypothetical protein ACD_45C00717G0004 [uncultured bacterium]|nr:MAG: hypothetical protein ACD_45C00717G0004 [uncultured bacterium]
MFWKNVKKILAHTQSIKIRLILFYTIATTSLLICITLSSYWVMVSTIYQAEHQFLSDEIDILQHIIHKKQHDISALKQEITEIPFILDNSIYRYYIRILDDKNQPIIETSGMQKAIQGAPFFFAHLTHKQSHWWHSADGTDYLLMQAAVTFSEAKHVWTIQVALDVSYERHIIKKYRVYLFITLLTGIICALILGYIIANKSMRRLYDLTETTKNITATSLHQRINLQFWPSELRALGMAFNEMLDRIELSFSRLTQFSDDLAHELRTPVNNLIGETELVLSRSSTIEEYQQILESNLEESHRLSQVIENILFLARTENPKLEIKKNLVQVNEEIGLICDFYQALADEKNIQITLSGKATLHANPTMFRRMLNNILANALKYTPEYGKIDFTITEMQNNRIEIILRDNGIGIAAEHIPKLFNRFYRIDNARSHLSGGIGLGLPIVKSIIDLHHGTISITSIPEKGTIITIYLPK